MSVEENLALMNEIDSMKNERSAPATGNSKDWLSLHDTILDAYLDGEEDWESDAIKSLAKTLKCDVGELEAILAEINPDFFGVKRLNKILERHNMTKIGYNWSSLEAAVVSKLSKMVQTGLVKNAGDLLAIAKTANSAIRRGDSDKVPKVVGDSNLPPPGNLGRIELHLHQRTVHQLSQKKVIDIDGETLADRIGMLQPTDIEELTLLVDSKNA